MSFLSTGAVDCPCIDTSIYASNIQNCMFNDTETGFWRYRLTSNSVGPGSCFPSSYGSGHCAKHDMAADPLCNIDSDPDEASSIPEFCQQSWCYIDPKKCKLSNERFYSSAFSQFRDQGVFYSYSTCNSTNDAWESFTTTEDIESQELNVVLPLIWHSVHYKDSTTGDFGEADYYDDTVPWKGWVIDYLDAVLELSNIGAFNYTFRSIGSNETSQSEFTAAVSDVQAGISDVAASALWITSERLSMTTFTTQTGNDRLLLWIPSPTISASGYAEKVLEPFDPSLWACLVVIILLVSAMSLWFATPMSTRRTWWKQMRSEKWKTESFPKRIVLATRILVDAFIAYSTYFFGHTVEYDIRASYPAKVLSFGYGFLVLIAVAAYTANLAAFLTLAGVSSYIETMEQAIEANILICAPVALKLDLEKKWQDASFLYYNSQFVDMFGVFDAGKCGVLLASEIDTEQAADTISGFCDRELVTTYTSALDTPIGFAVNRKYAAALSFWMEQAEAVGVTFESFQKAAVVRPRCTLTIPDVEVDELVSLTPANFALPFFVMGVCAVMAIVIHILEEREKVSAQKLDESAAESPKNVPEQKKRQFSLLSADSSRPSTMFTQASSQPSSLATTTTAEFKNGSKAPSGSNLGAIHEKQEEASLEDCIPTSLGPRKQSLGLPTRSTRSSLMNKSRARPSFMDAATLPEDIDHLQTLLEMMRDMQEDQSRLHADQKKLVDRMEAQGVEKKDI